MKCARRREVDRDRGIHSRGHLFLLDLRGFDDDVHLHPSEDGRSQVSPLWRFYWILIGTLFVSDFVSGDWIHRLKFALGVLFLTCALAPWKDRP